MTTATITTAAAPSEATPAPTFLIDPHADRVAGLTTMLADARRAYDAAGAIVSQRQAALGDATALIAQRRATFADATAQAQALADEAIRAGKDTTRQKRAADKLALAAFKAQQDISAAEATISALRADVSAAVAAQQALAPNMASLETALANAQFEAAREALYGECDAAGALLLDLARRMRAHNAAVAQQGRAPGQASRNGRDNLLVLPGGAAHARYDPAQTSDGRSGARQGVTIRFAPDLCSPTVSEATVLAANN